VKSAGSITTGDSASSSASTSTSSPVTTPPGVLPWRFHDCLRRCRRRAGFGIRRQRSAMARRDRTRADRPQAERPGRSIAGPAGTGTKSAGKIRRSGLVPVSRCGQRCRTRLADLHQRSAPDDYYIRTYILGTARWQW